MEFCRHVVALIPISFPLSKYWEARRYAKVYIVLTSEGFRSRYIPNIVIVRKIFYVSWQLSFKTFNSLFAVTWNVLIIIHSSKFTFYSSCLIENIKVFFNFDITPVRYLNCPCRFCEHWDWLTIDEVHS